MPVKLGNNAISKIYLGSTAISKAYLGSTLVFQNNVTFENITPPVISVFGSADPMFGETLQVTPGTWIGSPMLTYQWYRNGFPIVGATGTTYTLTVQDSGSEISLLEIPNGQLLLGELSNTLEMFDFGEEFLSTNGHYYFDLTRLEGNNADQITNGMTALNDLGTAGLAATIVGTPLIEKRATTDISQTRTGLRDISTNCLNINSNGQAFFQSSFELFFVFQMTDGRPTASHNIFGGRLTGGHGVNVYITNIGILGFEYGTSLSSVNLQLADAFSNNETGFVVLRIRMDFGADVAKFFINGVEFSPSIISGSMAIDPANYANTRSIYLGSLNNNGTTVTNASTNWILASAATPLLTDTEAELVLFSLYEKIGWRGEIHIANESDIATKRTEIIDFVTNGNGFDSITPTVTSNYTGTNCHIITRASITSYNTLDRWSFVKNDIDGFAWTNVVYYFTTHVTPINKLIIVCQGHISDEQSGISNSINRALSDGYDVLYMAMPITSADNTETNPTITSTSSNGHNQMFTGGLDRVGYSPLELFFFEKTSSLSYLESQSIIYDNIYLAGNSGGAWVGVIWGAMDERISKISLNRGVMPRSFRWNLINTDYEQGGAYFNDDLDGPRLYTFLYNNTFMDFILMCTSNSRMVQAHTHISDTCCFKGNAQNVFTSELISIAASWGGVYGYILDTDPTRSLHAFSSYDIDNTMDFFS
jgi:hypothetical protein